MKEIEFPTTHFYLWSRIGSSDYVLAADASNRLVLQHLDGTIGQMWQATPDPREGSALVHLGTGMVLDCPIKRSFPAPGSGLSGGPELLFLAPRETQRAEQLWRLEQFSGDWRGINAHLDWERKVNVYGSDPNGNIGMYKYDNQSPNECWQVLEKAGHMERVSIHYDPPQVTMEPPTEVNARKEFDNTAAATPLEVESHLEYEVTNSYSVNQSTTDTTAERYMQTFGTEIEVDVFTVSYEQQSERSSSHTVSTGKDTAHSETVRDATTIRSQVPPGKKYQYKMMAQYGRVRVPYTATMRFHSTLPGIKPVEMEVTGVFEGRNAVSAIASMTDITEQAPAPALDDQGGAPADITISYVIPDLGVIADGIPAG